MVFVRTFGSASIDAETAHLTPSSVRKFAFCLYLWAERGRSITRATLHDLIFPEQTSTNARHSIREQVYKFRKLGARIASDDETVELVPESLQADYSDLLQQDRPTLEQLNAAEGGFLPGYAPTLSEAFTEWLEGFRRRATLELTRVFVAELNRARRVSDWTIAGAAARAILALDPMHEEATLASAELLAINGAKTEAVRLLDRYIVEVGSASPELKLPATLLRRRISEQSREIYRAPLTLPFLGRDAEMAALQERFTRVQAGEAQCVVIVGEAGIGKTRLAEELCTHAVLAGARVERVAMQPYDVHRPMATFADLVPRLLSLPGALGCSPQSIAALKRLTRDEQVDQQEPDCEASSWAIAAAIARAIADLVDAVAGESPLLIVVDDAQWADEQSQQMLWSLTAIRSERRLMIMLTSRVDNTLRRFSQHSVGCLGLALKRLPAYQLNELTRRTFADRQIVGDHELKDWIATTSGGNPFFLKCLISHYQSTGERFVVPNDISELLDQEIAALVPEAATTLRMCVLLGRQSLFDRLSSALELPQIQLYVAINELERHHLVTLIDGSVQPSHWLVAEAAERSATPASLALMHRRVATVLEQSTDESDLTSQLWDCTEHWILAGDDARAAELVRKCASSATRIGRPREASELLLRAATMLSENRRSELLSEAIQLADSVSETDVVVRGFGFAKSHGIRVDFEGAELAELFARQSECSDVDDLRDRLLAWLANGTATRLRLRAALALLILAEHLVSRELADIVFATMKDIECPQNTHEQLTFLFCLLVFHSTFGSLEECRSTADRLLGMCQRLDSIAAADVRRKVGIGVLRLGDVARAIEILEAAYTEAASCRLLRLQLNLAVALIGIFASVGNFLEQGHWLDEVERLAREEPTLSESPLYAALHADLACNRRDPDMAEYWLERAANSFASQPFGRMRRWHTVFSLRARHLRGEVSNVDAAVQCLTAHHQRGLEVGEVSDSEVALAIEMLVGANQATKAKEVAVRYFRDCRRARQPVDAWLRSALNSCEPMWAQRDFVIDAAESRTGVAIAS
jgi:DNA-binding SARP family transcriptional activator